MIRFRAMATEADWEWVRARAWPILCADTQGIVAFEETTGEIKAVVVMDSWGRDSCSVHMAIESPMAVRRGLFREVANHVFNTCSRDRMFGMVPASNAAALKLDKKIGFEEVARIPNGFETGDDYIILCLEKDKCRWHDKLEKAA